LINRNFSKNLIFFLALTFTNILFAAEFLATVSNAQVSRGESLSLTLTLKDANTRDTPDLTVLQKDFTIYGQQQYSTYSNTNGTIVAESGWEITLLPKRDGTIIIPSLGINTNKGKLGTKEIQITVAVANNKTQNSGQPAPDSFAVSLISTTNKAKAYVKEPIIYTLKIVSYRPPINLALDHIKATDAIIDRIGEPKQYDQSFGGIRSHIIELKYLITPLVPGKIEISPAVVRGEIHEPAPPGARSSKFGMLHNFFFDNVGALRPFEIESDKITITSIAPPVATKDWLPVNKLELSEEWTGEASAKVGDTISRKVKIIATGNYSNQLPSVQSAMNIRDIKLYSDKPVLSDKVSVDNEYIVGTKEESFSVVPTKEGTIKFPEIKISWWNIKTKQMEVSTLPAKTMHILAAVKSAGNDMTIDYSAGEQKIISEAPTNTFWDLAKQHAWLIAVIASLVILILALFAVIIYLLRSKTKTQVNLADETKTAAKAKNKNIEISSAADLRDHILEHAHKHWGCPTDLTLNKLGTYLSENNYVYNIEYYVALTKDISSALYAGGNLEIQELLEKWENLKTSVTRNKTRKIEQTDEDYINLNPT
jgi:hypothetical protein